MREIKVRAWDRYNKVWIGPYTLKQLAGDDQFNFDTEVHPICSKFEDFEWVEYTGLTDRHGKEIYECDIVKYHHYNDFEGWYLVEYKEAGFYPFMDIWSGTHTLDGFEIIGNMYENPELQEVTK